MFRNHQGKLNPLEIPMRADEINQLLQYHSPTPINSPAPGNYAREYERMRCEYMKNETYKKVKPLINRMARSYKIPSHHQTLPIRDILKQIAKDMLLTEIEIVIWAIYLEKFAWRKNNTNLRNDLLLTAYSVKVYLGENR